MAYDELIADRVRDLLADRDVREIKMFGGLAFMVEDRMVACVSAAGSDLLVRVDPAADPDLVTRPGARRPEMGQGRSMGEGWIGVDGQALASEEDLRFWLDAALTFHATGSGKKKTKKT